MCQPHAGCCLKVTSHPCSAHDALHWHVTVLSLHTSHTLDSWWIRICVHGSARLLPAIDLAPLQCPPNAVGSLHLAMIHTAASWGGPISTSTADSAPLQCQPSAVGSRQTCQHNLQRQTHSSLLGRPCFSINGRQRTSAVPAHHALHRTVLSLLPSHTLDS
jgi:hypothetical protein